MPFRGRDDTQNEAIASRHVFSHRRTGRPWLQRLSQSFPAWHYAAAGRFVIVWLRSEAGFSDPAGQHDLARAAVVQPLVCAFLIRVQQRIVDPVIPHGGAINCKRVIHGIPPHFINHAGLYESSAPIIRPLPRVVRRRLLLFSEVSVIGHADQSSRRAICVVNFDHAPARLRASATWHGSRNSRTDFSAPAVVPRTKPSNRNKTDRHDGQ
jgi:hypothetical protein